MRSDSTIRANVRRSLPNAGSPPDVGWGGWGGVCERRCEQVTGVTGHQQGCHRLLRCHCGVRVSPRRSASGSRFVGSAVTPPLYRVRLLSSALRPRGLIAPCGPEHQGIDGTGTGPAEQPGHDSHRPTGVPIIVEEQESTPARDTFRDFGRYRERVDHRA